jgi:hypothetical protein
MVTANDISDEKKEKYRAWNTLFRNNISIFIEFYMEVYLHPYQRYWVNLMNKSTVFWAIASRASAKSWLFAVYAIARCILYPGTIISINSSTKSQAGLILSEKCKELRNTHPNIARESINIIVNPNKYEMIFHNSSRIVVIISGETGRGFRSHVALLEERRLIPTIIIDSIIRPFLISRQPPYQNLEKYKDLPKEEPQEIVITSAYFRTYEWWIDAKKHLQMIANGDSDTKAIILDYLILLKHKLKTMKQMKKEKERMDSISFYQEYGNIPFSSSDNFFYNVGLFNRQIKRYWRPQKDDITDSKAKNKYDIPKVTGERRVVSVDIAMRKGSVNDNTIISCARLQPTSKGMSTDVCHLESHNGKNALLQALRIKQIFYEFTHFDENAVLVLDVAGAGIAVFDALTQVTKDESRGLEYPAMTVMNSPDLDAKVIDELRERTLGQNALPCIFPISATQQLNSIIAINFRERLKKKLVRFPADESIEEEFLIKSGNNDILDQEDQTMRPYLLQSAVQTTLMINEAVSLEAQYNGGLVKLIEPPNGRKDRVSSISYLNYYCSLLDRELLREGDDSESEWDTVSGVTFVF